MLAPHDLTNQQRRLTERKLELLDPADEVSRKGSFWKNEDGQLHRTRGPAAILTDGSVEYYLNGQRHRDDGPAIEQADGTKEWYQNGQLDRDDGPAIERTNGTTEWFQNDHRHRDHGPAIEHVDDFKAWFQNGRRQYFHQRGMRGPLWMTEFGYPADNAFQFDAKYRGAGQESQAAYLAKTMPEIIRGGGEMIFVTQRDWGQGHFASEGILSAPDPLPENPLVSRKKSFAVVQQAAISLIAPLPAGITEISSWQSNRVRVIRSKIMLRFACPYAGDCPATRFRLIFSNKRGYFLATAIIKAGSSSISSLPITSHTIRSLKRSGREGLKFNLVSRQVELKPKPMKLIN